MSDYRTPGEALRDGPEPLKKGPAKACRGCGAEVRVKRSKRLSESTSRMYDYFDDGRDAASPLPEPRACTSGRRVGWLWWKCCVPGEHLHERCKVCGLEWLTAFAEGA